MRNVNPLKLECLRYATTFFNPFLPSICLVLLFDSCLSVYSLTANKCKKSFVVLVRIVENNDCLDYFDKRFRMHQKIQNINLFDVYVTLFVCLKYIKFPFLLTIHVFLLQIIICT